MADCAEPGAGAYHIESRRELHAPGADLAGVWLHHKFGALRHRAQLPERSLSRRADSVALLQFRILREKGTEMAGSSKLDSHYPKQGTYNCAGCA